MPLQATSGAASYDAFGGGVAAVPNYIEDVFSTWLYTGNGSTQTINNGIDLAGKGGMVWIKDRNSTVSGHGLWDTNRGAYKFLTSSSSGAQVDASGSGLQYGVGSFNANGFTLPTPNQDYWNASGTTYVSWTFRKQPKFFDVVTYTGNGTAGRTVAHNLGSVPGCVIVKCTSVDNGAWRVYHRGLTSSAYRVNLNTTNAEAVDNGIWNSTAPTSTVFTVGGDISVNDSGQTYVAYLFAHNAGGFGLTGTDNVISCGSFTTDGSGNASVNLGYEPQWVMWKAASRIGGWNMLDNMRGFTVGGSDALLSAQASSAEINIDLGSPTATGFTAAVESSATYIYIAIRRGPMRTPTTGTSVFSPNLSSSGTGTQITTGFPVDAQISNVTSGGNHAIYDRLRGVTSTTTQSAQYLVTNLTDAELTTTNQVRAWNNTGFQLASGLSGIPVAYWNFRRAPGFFDVVCYNGNSSTQTITHNLAAVPELMIVKIRNGVSGWPVYSSALGNTKFVRLNTTSAESVDNVWANTSPTSSSFTVGNNGDVNQSGGTYVAYLFASCPGVSKVGSYTGTGSSQTIDCGFAGGARFVLIKRTDSTGNWLVWDSARGIVASPGNSPSLALNATAAEVSNFNIIVPESSGFGIGPTSLASVNASGATYIFLAIA